MNRYPDNHHPIEKIGLGATIITVVVSAIGTVSIVLFLAAGALHQLPSEVRWLLVGLGAFIWLSYVIGDWFVGASQ